MRTVFAFTSWGNAGVPFILNCLNTHPQVRAYSNLRYAACSPWGREVSAAEYLDAIGRLNWTEHMTCGDVHGVSPYELPGLHEAFGETFRGAHLTGHPIQRLAGSLLFSKEAGRNWTYEDFRNMWSFAPDDPQATAFYAVAGPQGNYVAANYMLHVNNVVVLHGVDGPKSDPLIPLEPLLVSGKAWDALIAHLSGGEITAFGDYWRRFLGDVPNLAHQPFTVTPKAVWDSFDEEVRRLVAATLTEEARAVYGALGYDLSFVR